MFSLYSAMRIRAGHFTAALLAVLLTISASAHAAQALSTHTEDAEVMGTTLEITLRAPDEATAGRAFAAARAELDRVESLMSEWREGTPVWRINENAGVSPVNVPGELYRVISAALEVSRLSGGAFDVTWAAMRGLWDFTKERVPGPGEVERAVSLVDYRDVILDPEEKSVFLRRPGMALGLGGIAKGFAVDLAARAIVEAGVEHLIIKAGGDMRVQGAGPDGPWKIGIQHPRKPDDLLATLPVTDVSVSTSGDYERYFIIDGVRYHHIIDPSTGYPARGVMSVTVIGPDTMTTDALSTAVFILGPDEGIGLVERLAGVEALVVGSDGKMYASGGISGAAPAGGVSP